MTIQQAYEQALQHHQAGRLAEAEAIYRQILAVEPRHADALHLLGVIAHQVGRHDVAVELIRQAIALSPGVPDFHSNLGSALKGQGQLDEAMAACRRALALKPNLPEAHSNLGRSLYQKGQLDDAIAAYRQAIALQPNLPETYCHLGNALHNKGQMPEAIAAYRQALALRSNYPNAHHNLGVALYDNGQSDEAVAAYRRALALQLDYPEAYYNLGVALQATGQLEEAIAAYRQAIALQPDLAEAHNNLGNALKDQGRLDEAIDAYRQAIALQPDYPEAHSHLGAALHETEHFEEAVAACRQALALQPNLAEAHNNLGNALKDQGHLEAAIAAYRKALALKPDLAEACNNLGNAFKDQGQLDEALAAYRQGLSLKPTAADTHSNLLLTLNYHPNVDPQAIAEELRRWNQQHAEPLRPLSAPHPNLRDPHRRLRVGYVSPDFRGHSVACFLESLLASHDPAQVEVFCYAHVSRPDAVTARLQRHAAQWRNIVGTPDAQVAELIRQDGIDLLVDLAGHTGGNRLLVFARQPAPVQVTWLGYPGSTGLPTIGYRLTDAFADPPGAAAEHLHTEQLVRLPQGAWCFRPPEVALAVSAPPVREAGHITFGCFNTRTKINAPLLRLWSEILRAVPASRLLLKNRAALDACAQQQVRAVFENASLGPERVEVAGYAARLDAHLAAYGRVDIALDTFPYHGTTTTCEALWMGVPVVTLAGRTHVSRVGVSLLNHIGLTELVAETPADYVRLATELALDLPRLAELRRTLRPRMAASPLMDAPGFARAIEDAYREMWRAWCEKQPSNFPAP